MLIDVRGLEKAFRDRQGQPVRVLNGVNLQVGRGDFLALMGKSGSGKSTLLNILGCLDRPEAGSYHFDGEDVVAWPERRRAELRNRRIGFVFQSFHLLPFLTVEENVLLPLLYGPERPGSIVELLASVGLADKSRRHPGELSGGEQQRVAIARALVLGADLILADEPTGNLDAGMAQEILDLFERLVGQGKTVLLVTHDPVVAARARRRIHMQAGQAAASADAGATGEAVPEGGRP